jgi:hypothetical protein
MARQTLKGPVHGPYLTFRLISRVNTPISQTAAVVDIIPMPADFRVCSVSWSALGVTAHAQAAVVNYAGTSGTGYADIDATTYGTRKLSDFGATSSGFRSVPQGDGLKLIVTTDGSGVVPAGALTVWVTGYFTSPITKASRYAEGRPQEAARSAATTIGSHSRTNG